MTPTTNFQAGYDEILAEGLATVRPGQVVPPDVEVAAGRFFEQASGLQRDQYLSNPFGYPIMPVPVGGRHRLPSNVNVEFAGHPAFWLEEAVANRRDGETESQWAVRLYMELLVRGWWDEVTGEWFDVLHVAEFDLNDATDRNRVTQYRDGEPDADLASLVIPQHADGVDDLDMPARHAAEIIEILTPVLAEVTVWADEEVRRSAEEARLLTHSDFDVMSKDAVRALVNYQQAVKAGRWSEMWPQTHDTLRDLNTQITNIGHSILDAVGPLLIASARDEYEYLEAVYALANQVQVNEDTRNSVFNDLMMQLRENGSDESLYRQIFDQLRSWHSALVAELLNVFNQVDRIGPDGRWDLPAEEQPEEDDSTSPLIPGGTLSLPELKRLPNATGTPMKAGDVFDPDLPSDSTG